MAAWSRAPPTLGPSNTVNEILQHDPVDTARVILLFASSAAIAASGRTDVWCSEAENYPPCESSQIISLWPDQDNATGVLDHIRSQPERDLNRFYVSQGQITPSEQLISRSSHPGSLREAAELYNPEVISMAAQQWRGTGANIIILDFFETRPSGTARRLPAPEWCLATQMNALPPELPPRQRISHLKSFA